MKEKKELRNELVDIIHILPARELKKLSIAVLGEMEALIHEIHARIDVSQKVMKEFSDRVKKISRPR